ncbi:helix-turn-helix domain-containing protein [Mycolicibacterium sp. 050232]|uniref:PucR family transcriptional regulator n=1 Tax=Mycolicibacterium sp. 050232 TaxID=3113982 RepID=UPI002E2BCDEE|nr:helix-turn-helix domain-containing protein [Mycolicibacterium sp. 050232]MED5814055.1 helix-turn-helix domain-containing protein [Mycolicibacterium sp. 050232]
MAGISQPDEATVAKAAAAITSRLVDKLAVITLSVQHSLVAAISELRGEEQLQQLLRDTVESNVETFFAAVRHGITVENVEPPTAALEYSRRLAQRDVSANALTRAYRLGHRGALRFVLDEVRAAELEPTLALAVYEFMESLSFDYIDEISLRVVEAYQDERERWLASRNTVRAARVRELLTSGVDVDLDAAALAIRYPLRRIHLAAIAWCNESDEGDELAGMERFANRFAESIGASEAPLFISVDRVTAWVWFAVPREVEADVVDRMRVFADAPYLAVGNTLSGVEGFRESHRQAADARSVALAAGEVAHRFTAASDSGVSVAALLGNDIDAAARWVGQVLGPLAEATDGDERLRDTLRAFLGSGSSYKTAAEELHLHTNSVKYRVAKAVERRGRPITGERLDVEVALLLCHYFGPALLHQSAEQT